MCPPWGECGWDLGNRWNEVGTRASQDPGAAGRLNGAGDLWKFLFRLSYFLS